MERCKHCGQPLRLTLFGVYLPPIRYRILSIVYKNPDLSLTAIATRTYGYPHKRKTASNITKINEDLAATDYQIKGPGGGNADGGYRLVRQKA